MNKKNHNGNKNTPILDKTNIINTPQNTNHTNQHKKNNHYLRQQEEKSNIPKESKVNQGNDNTDDIDNVFNITQDESINALLKEAQDLGIDLDDESDTLSNLTLSSTEDISEGVKKFNQLSDKIKQKKALLRKEAKKISIAHTLYHIKEKELKEHENKLSNNEEIEFKQRILLSNYDLVKNHVDNKCNHQEKEIAHIINEINLSLLQKNKTKFFHSLNLYIQDYKKNKKQTNYDKNNLTLEEKVELFHSNYFTDILKSEEIEVKYSLIEMMLKNYTHSIFFEAVNKYNLPLNIPIKESINSNHNYYPLWHIAIMFNKLEFIQDCLKVPRIMQEFNQPFYTKIIENNEIIEYEYHPFSSMNKLTENQIIYLIDINFLTSDSEIYTSFERKKNIFLFLMEQSYIQAFKLLYKKQINHLTEEKNNAVPTIKLNLKKIVTDKKKNNLLHHYIYALNEGEVKEVDKELIDIFIKEEFDLDYLNSDDLSAFDYCESISDKNLYLLCDYLYPIIPEHYKMMPQIEMLTNESNEDILISNVTIKEQEYVWYDRDKLMNHEKEIAKLKEASNHEYIKSMLNPQNYLKKNLLVENETLFDKLQEEFPNFKEVIQFYKGQFRVKKMSGKVRISPILLLGDPGIGKSYFAKKLSQYLKTGYTFLDMGSLSAGWVLTGNNGTWKDAKQGKILEAVMTSKTINPIVVMDELDKTNRSNYDPVSVLYQLLEEINAKEFTDEFIDFPIDASGVIYIACANNIQNIPEALLSRFKIFEISNPDEQQITHIIHNIYQENVKDLPIFERDITEPIVYKLKKYSLRAIKVMIEDAVSRALLELSNQELENKLKHIELNEKHFIEPKKKTMIGF